MLKSFIGLLFPSSIAGIVFATHVIVFDATPPKIAEVIQHPEHVPEISRLLPSPSPSPSPTPDDHNFAKTETYDVPPTGQAKGTVRIPVLTYHHVAPMTTVDSAKAYYVTPDMFDRQMKYLKDKNYKVLTVQEFVAQVKSGKNPEQKEVLITFDDGNYDNYQYAYPILKKYGFSGVFFISSMNLMIPAPKIKEMSDNGMQIGSHAEHHVDLRKLTDASKIAAEVGGSKSGLQNITGKPVYAIAYPGCTFSDQVISEALKDGYILGVSCGTKIDHTKNSLWGLHRIHVYSDFQNFTELLSGHVSVSFNY